MNSLPEARQARPLNPLPPGAEHDLGWVQPLLGGAYLVSVRQSELRDYEVMGRPIRGTVPVILTRRPTLEEAVAAGEHAVAECVPIPEMVVRFRREDQEMQADSRGDRRREWYPPTGSVRGA